MNNETQVGLLPPLVFRERIELVNLIYEMERIAIKLAYKDWIDSDFNGLVDELSAKRNAITQVIWSLGFQLTEEAK